MWIREAEIRSAISKAVRFIHGLPGIGMAIFAWCFVGMLPPMTTLIPTSPWYVVGCLLGAVVPAALILVARRVTGHSTSYTKWGLREWFAVLVFASYGMAGFFCRPRSPAMMELVWMASILVQAVVFACSLYLQNWFDSNMSSSAVRTDRRLHHQLALQIFRSTWTGIAAVLVVMGIVISASGPFQMIEEQKSKALLTVLAYTILTVFAVILWILRPLFVKAVTIADGEN